MIISIQPALLLLQHPLLTSHHLSGQERFNIQSAIRYSFLSYVCFELGQNIDYPCFVWLDDSDVDKWIIE